MKDKMHFSPQADSEILFNNRKAFLRFNQYKLDRTLKTLSKKDRNIFMCIPRLLHVNQEGLPGFVDDEEVPCGIYNYTVDRGSQHHLEQLFPKQILRRKKNFNPVIHSVLLIGSVGSIAQTGKSDLDYTLLVEISRFTPKTLSLFKRKLQLIEEWIWGRFNLETHFFINDYKEVKSNIFGESDSESTGSAQGKLLKEEMYRTMIVTAGKIPFWWIVPVETSDEKYEELFQLINSRKTLLNRDEFLDIGNVEDISEGEFFGGSIWTLIKSFKSPFKTLMKMGLLEEYMFSETKFNLLCHQIKRNVFSENFHTQVDPYLMLFDRAEKFFGKTKSDNEVDALRTAFYMKVGTKLSPEEFQNGSNNPQKSILIKMFQSWGWSPSKIAQLNDYSGWQMKNKVALGSRISKILMTSYKNISEKNKAIAPGESLITEKDTHLLGRKLFSYYRKSPNKVENLFSLIDGKTAENELTFLYDHQSSIKNSSWYLIRGRTFSYIEQINPENIIKRAATLPFLVSFTAFNGLFNDSTQILIRGDNQSFRESDLRIILKQLNASIGHVNVAAIANEDLLAPARINKLYLIMDFGTPVPREIVVGNINECKTSDELNQFLDKRIDKTKFLTSIYLTSWGEFFCKTYFGLNSLNRCLAELNPQIAPEIITEKGFLKIFIPTGRREVLQIPWLNSYLLKMLKIRKTAYSEKAAS